jgi:hypothetical protein
MFGAPLMKRLTGQPQIVHAKNALRSLAIVCQCGQHDQCYQPQRGQNREQFETGEAWISALPGWSIVRVDAPRKSSSLRL